MLKIRAISSETTRIFRIDKTLAYNERGLAYFDSNNLEQAITDFSTAIDINPDFAVAYYNRGRAYDLEQALADFSTALNQK